MDFAFNNEILPTSLIATLIKKSKTEIFTIDWEFICNKWLSLAEIIKMLITESQTTLKTLELYSTPKKFPMELVGKFPILTTLTLVGNACSNLYGPVLQKILDDLPMLQNLTVEVSKKPQGYQYEPSFDNLVWGNHLKSLQIIVDSSQCVFKLPVGLEHLSITKNNNCWVGAVSRIINYQDVFTENLQTCVLTAVTIDYRELDKLEKCPLKV